MPDRKDSPPGRAWAPVEGEARWPRFLPGDDPLRAIFDLADDCATPEQFGRLMFHVLGRTAEGTISTDDWLLLAANDGLWDTIRERALRLAAEKGNR